MTSYGDDPPPAAYGVEMGNDSVIYRKASRALRNSKHNRNDEDAGSDIDDNDIGHISDANHYNNNPSSAEYNNHMSSHSLQRIASARDEWNLDERSANPAEGLKCIWIILILLSIGTLASLSCYDSYIVSLFADLGNDGTYEWSFGYLSQKWQFLDDASTSANIERTEAQMPMKFTKRYAKDAGNLLLFSLLVTIAALCYILFVICSRCNAGRLLYVKCCGIRIPQRGSLYVSFSLIKNFCWVTVVYYVFVSIYGLLEISFYTSYLCATDTNVPTGLGVGSGGVCAPYTIPHYGYWTLTIMTGILTCFVFSRVQKLDVRFSLKTLKLFYPNNIRAAQSRNCSIDMSYLLKALNTSINIIIITMVMSVACQHSSLIQVVVNDETLSSGDNQVVLFQPLGLTNKNSEWQNASEFDAFNSVAVVLSVFIPIMCLFNIFYQLYMYFVVINYKSIGCCKFSFILLSFIQWLIFTVLICVYYVEFFFFFNDYGKANPEEVLWDDVSGSSYNIVWYPDWGIALVMLLEFYMIHLMYVSFKAM